MEKERRAMMYALNCFGWGIWFYLWRPIITGIAWLLGIEFADRHWVYLHGYNSFFEFVTETMPFGIGLCATLLIWASFNYFRFRGRERRNTPAQPSLSTDAKWTKLTPEILGGARMQKAVICDYDQSGVMVAVSAK